MKASIRDFLTVKAFPVGTSHHPWEWLVATRAARQCFVFVVSPDTWIGDLPYLWLCGATIVGSILLTRKAFSLNTRFFSSAVPSWVCRASPSCCPRSRNLQLLLFSAFTAINWLFRTVFTSVWVQERKGIYLCHGKMRFVSCTSPSCFHL